MTPFQDRKVLVAIFVGWLAVLLVLLQAHLLFADTVVTIGIFFIAVMGLDIIFGYAGQLSMGHVGTFAIGAYGVAVLGKFFGLSPWLTALGGLAVNVLIALSLGRVLLRLSGNYFVLGAFAFGLIVEAVIRIWTPVTGGDNGIGDIQRPGLPGLSLDVNLSFGIFAWVLAFLFFLFAINLARSHVGRSMRAMRDDEVAAGSNGIHITRLKLNAYLVSVVYASAAGSLFASYIRAVHPDSFSLPALLDMVLMLALGGDGTIWGGLLGATLVRLLPDISGVFRDYRILVNGLVFAAVLFLFPEGFAGLVRRAAGRVWRTNGATVSGPQRESSTPRPPRTSAVPEIADPSNGMDRTPRTLLEVSTVSRYFGGVRAVDNITFNVREGSIKSIIGPNGAGKSTLLNVISGVDRPRSGNVRLFEQDITGLRSDQVALLGVGRTFQNLRLFESLTALENVMVGCLRRSHGQVADLIRAGVGFPALAVEEDSLRERSRAWLASLGLLPYENAPARNLAYGHRKLVELARAAVSAPRLLLLDEPAAGLNEVEKHEFRNTVAELRRAGTTIVLIEHDMDFVMGLSDEVLVMNFGCVIAEDTPSAVQRNEAVLAAYLGT